MNLLWGWKAAGGAGLVVRKTGACFIHRMDPEIKQEAAMGFLCSSIGGPIYFL